MEKYFNAKKKLFLLSKKSTAVINTDNPWGKKLTEQIPGKIVTYGLESGTMVFAESYSLKPNGTELKVKFPGGYLSLCSHLLGKHNIYNILAATAAALALKIPIKFILAGIASLKGVPGRFEKIENSIGLNIFVDYAHTDDALMNLLETARELSRGKILVIFGAGGDRDKSKRARMGEIAGKLADWAVITSDNPRSEDPMEIISEIEKGILKTGSGKYDIEPDRRTAIKKTLARGKDGDYILIAGKGHENYQIIKNKIINFDDAQVTREILKEMEV